MAEQGFSEEESKPALIDAFSRTKRGRIEVRGRSKEWLTHTTPADLGGQVWDNAEPDWEKNVLIRHARVRGRHYQITEIGVSRIGLERWLKTAADDAEVLEQPPAAVKTSQRANRKLEDLWKRCLTDGTVVDGELMRHDTRTKLREELARKAGCGLPHVTKTLKDAMNEVLGEEMPGRKASK